MMIGEWCALLTALAFDFFLAILGLFRFSTYLTKCFSSYLSLFSLYSQLFAKLTISPKSYLFTRLINYSVIPVNFWNFYCQLKLYAAWISAFYWHKTISFYIFLYFFMIFMFSTWKVYALTFHKPFIYSNSISFFSN